MTSDRLKNLIAKTVNEDGLVSSAVYLVAENGDIVDLRASGTMNSETGAIVTTDTIYDLASLTKPLVTGLLTALLIEKGVLTLDDTVRSFFSEFAGNRKSGITIKQLASHVSGLPAWVPFYLQDGVETPKQRVLARILYVSLAADPETEVIYSDLNFILLGLILEKITGEDLDKLAERFIFGPLGLHRTFFNPPDELRPSIAASEFGNRYEKEMCRELYPDTDPPDGFFRNGLIWGEVHDGNCYFMDGVAGHAGLFSNAPETFRIALQFLAGTSELLSPETCRLFWRDLTPSLNQARSLAFQLAATKNSSAGPDLPAESFGHLGFTGTSLWIDPTRQRVYILLTNRTHNKVPPFPDLASLRKKFNSTAHMLLENKNI